MPELPEVETVRRTLEPDLVGQRIETIEVYYSGIIKKPAAEQFGELIKGRLINSLRRRGKYLLFELSGDYTLVIHLRMTGQLTLTEKTPGTGKSKAAVSGNNTELSRHTHLIFKLSSGQQLRFSDIRKFGMVYLIPTGEWQEAGGLGSLGPEPLEDEFTVARLASIMKGKKGRLKAFLLDQTKIAGIGNIYADEIMFEAALAPVRCIGTLDNAEIERLYAAICVKLQEGIQHQGTTVRNYVNGRGQKGSFQQKLKVYGCAGKPCTRCGTTLLRAIVCGRGTVFCPHCQF